MLAVTMPDGSKYSLNSYILSEPDKYSTVELALKEIKAEFNNLEFVQPTSLSNAPRFWKEKRDSIDTRKSDETDNSLCSNSPI